MFPIALDLTKIPVLLIGKGEAFTRRHRQLLEFGASSLSLWEREGGEGDCGNSFSFPHPNPNPLSEGEGRIVMIAGLSRPVSEQLANAARAAGKLVNVEDMNDLCDFYFTANVKRGDLLIAVSTGGASPTLSRKIRDYIAGIFGTEWEAYTAEIARFRKKLKADGKSIPEVLKESEKFLADKGWLK